MDHHSKKAKINSYITSFSSKYDIRYLYLLYLDRLIFHKAESKNPIMLLVILHFQRNKIGRSHDMFDDDILIYKYNVFLVCFFSLSQRRLAEINKEFQNGI